MSCLRIRKIANPLAQDRVGRFDKQYISIPDCNCSECRKKKKNDWLVRSYFDFTSFPQDVFFVTLDFDNDHLPRYGVDEQPCFDGQIITSFTESLRSALGKSFRYLITPDYGAAFKRPHYHCAFEFPKGSVSKEDFFLYVIKFWKYGNHTDIQQINTSFKNPFKAFEYICKYSLKDINYKIRILERSLPYRYRSQVHASVGYGAQCLDPSEFVSSNLIKQGVRFLDTPVITKEYLKTYNTISVNLSNDNSLSTFSIPRYYEIKLAYDYNWDSVEKKSVQIKNDLGLELQKIRHNCHYDFYKRKFELSRFSDITNYKFIHKMLYKFFPESPYNGMMWKDICEDVLSSENFDTYIRIKDYLDYGHSVKLEDDSFFYRQILSLIPSPWRDVNGNCYYLVSSCDQNVESDKFFISEFQFNRCIEACFVFDLYNLILKTMQYDYGQWKDQEETKAKMRDKIMKNDRYRSYLKYKNFNFSNLTPNTYVQQHCFETY